MNYIIEIGTKEQQNQIKAEITQLIEPVLDKLYVNDLVGGIIVPINFDQTIQEITGNADYTSEKGCLVLAKIVDYKDKTYIVVSPIAYTEDYDTFIRLILFFHELYHVINDLIHREQLNSLNLELTEHIYCNNLFSLYNEYSANRFSLEWFFNINLKISIKSLRYLIRCFSGHIDMFNKHNIYLRNIKREISSFRMKKNNIDTFIENIFPFYDEFSKNLIYISAYIDSHNHFRKKSFVLQENPFFDVNTKEMLLFFKQTYNSSKILNLRENQIIIEKFMENYGIKFTNTENGKYCRVLDI